MAGKFDTSALLKYPIGQCPQPLSLSRVERQATLDSIEAFPERLASALNGLNRSQLDTPYRASAWTISTLIHHLADCHLIAYTWTKLTLTQPPGQDWPVVFDYSVDALATLSDNRLDSAISVKLLDTVHRRWSGILRDIPSSDFAARGYIHPDTGRCSLDQMLAMYEWHGRHHLAHIMHCREVNGWK
jgi:hypothetical protein